MTDFVVVSGFVRYRCACGVDVPPRIALLGWSRGFIVDYGGHFRGDDGPLVCRFLTGFLFWSLWSDSCGIHIRRTPRFACDVGYRMIGV